MGCCVLLALTTNWQSKKLLLQSHNLTCEAETWAVQLHNLTKKLCISGKWKQLQIIAWSRCSHSLDAMHVVAGPGFHTDAAGRPRYRPRLQAHLFRLRRRCHAHRIPASPIPLLTQFLLHGRRWCGRASIPWPPMITDEGRETDRIKRREKNWRGELPLHVSLPTPGR